MVFSLSVRIVCLMASDIDVNPTVTMHAATKLMYLIIMNASQQTLRCLTLGPVGSR